MLKQPFTSLERGFLIFELLLSIFILTTLGVVILTFTSRHLRVTRMLNSTLQPDCEHATCMRGEVVTTCTCGEQKYVVLQK